MNELLNDVKGVVNDWSKLFEVIIKAKKATFKSCGLDKTPGASIKHVLVGMPLMFVADCNMSLAELKKCIKFTPEDTKMPVKFTLVQKYEGLIKNLIKWIKGYFDAFGKMGSIAEKIAGIPEKATECTKNAPSEFADLDLMAKAKMIKTVASTVSKIKDKCEKITEEMKAVKNDL